MGSGGVSGEVKFPIYIEDAHKDWLNRSGTDTLLAPISGSATVPVSLAKVMSHALGFQGNPYEGQSYSNPGGAFLVVRNLATDHKDTVDAFSPSQEWLSSLYGSSAAMDSVLREIVADAMVGKARGDALDVIRAANLEADAGVEEKANWQEFITAAIAKIDAAGTLQNVDTGAIAEAARSGSIAAVTQALISAETELDEREDWSKVAETARGFVGELGLGVEDIQLIFGQVSSVTRDVLRNAFAGVKEVLDGIDFEDILEGTRQDLSYQKGRARASFKGQMAEINAVQSSAFAIGLGLIEAQSLADENRAAAELRLETYRGLIGQQAGVFSSLVGGVLQAHQQSAALQSEMIRSSIQHMVDLQVNRTRVEDSLRQLYGQLYNTELGNVASARQLEKQSRERLLLQASESMASMLANRVQVEQSIRQLAGQLFSTSLESRLRTEVANKTSHDQLMLTGAQTDFQGKVGKLEQGRQAVILAGETERLLSVAVAEHEGATMDLRSKAYLWDLQIFEKGANILAAPAGMAAALPEKPSRVGSVLGGAVGGAAAGAALGPPGMAAGAVLGGLAGLFG